MTKSCIYYTDCHAEPLILKTCQEQLRKSFPWEIVCVSLRPVDFGDKRIVLSGLNRSYPTYLKQILAGLENATSEVVFFTEHDVLYHPSHFEYEPEKPDVYYYNINNYRWRYPTEFAITYDQLHSLSGMCCNRETAIKHYKYRIQVMEEMHLDVNRAREPRWARRFGYEPGTKPKARGGITDETFITWKSAFPNVDIRHRYTFSKPKTTKEEFIHFPDTFREVTIDTIQGWNLKEMFNL